MDGKDKGGLSDPEISVKKAAKELKSSSRIYITTDDVDVLILRMQKAKWRMTNEQFDFERK